MQGTNRPLCIFIAGPPFSGKSTVGSLLSGLIEIPFFDLDETIESKGTSIPEIFSSKGEASFRVTEDAALRETIASQNTFVLALGGGTLLNPENLQLCLGTGIILTLHADIEDILSRYHNTDQIRPLAGDENTLRILHAKRKGHYSSLPNQIDTTDRLPQEITEYAKLFVRDYFR